MYFKISASLFNFKLGDVDINLPFNLYPENCLVKSMMQSMQQNFAIIYQNVIDVPNAVHFVFETSRYSDLDQNV